jgi:RNA polymerase sigma factor (sigma-70 family)
MAELTQADRYLLEQIAQGNADAWSQLVERYQGRLLAYARSRLRSRSDADDLVQDTFVALLQSIRTFRRECSLETFLFTVLRRKIIDVFRGRRIHDCLLSETLAGESDEPRAAQAVAPAPSASWYVAGREQTDRQREVFAEALNALVSRLKRAENLRDLRIIEMLFYAQLRNKDAAKLVDMDEKQIALIKHRCLKEIRSAVEASLAVQQACSSMDWDAPDDAHSMLTEVWEQERPTCPKRSTVGRFSLGTLESPWREYVEFHIDTLGCRFCRANLDDLRNVDAPDRSALRERIFQSTIGFLHSAGQ